MALRLRRGTDAERLIMTPPEAGELIYTTDTKAVWVGDGTTVGGLPVSGEALGLNDLGDVNLGGEVNPGDVLQFNGSGWISAPSPDKTGNVYGEDSVLLIDTDNSVIVGPIVTDTAIIGDLVGDVTGNLDGNVTGNVVGNVTGNVIGSLDGDVTGSIFADDSTRILDGIDGTYYGGLLQGDVTRISNDPLTGNRPQLRIRHDKILGDTNLNSLQGNIHFEAELADGSITETAYMAGGTLGFFFINDYNLVGDFSESNTTTISANGIGFKTYTPQEALDIDGNALFTGFVQFGSLTTVERDALTAANGMVIYNTTDNKFQGYENGAWVNLV